MIKLSLDSSVAVRLEEKHITALSALEAKMTFLMQKLADKVKYEKLGGQVLKVESGLLQSSVEAVPTVVEGNAVVGSVIAATGDAWYGQVHEFGGLKSFVINPIYSKSESRRLGKGTLQPNKVLAFSIQGKEIFTRYVFHPPLPKRPFMAPALEEMMNEIKAGLREAVIGGLNS